MKKKSLFVSFLFFSLSFQNIEASFTGTVKLKRNKKKYGLILKTKNQKGFMQKEFFSQNTLKKERIWFKRLRRRNFYKNLEVEILLTRKLRPKEILLIGNVIKKKKAGKDTFFVQHPLYKMELPLIGKRYVLANEDRVSFRVKLDKKTKIPTAHIETQYL